VADDCVVVELGSLELKGQLRVTGAFKVRNASRDGLGELTGMTRR
jgi:hypothetical protein